MPAVGNQNSFNQPGSSSTIRTVTASVFGGPNDPGTGSTGYRGDNLNQKPDSFAELSTNFSAPVSQLDFAALGGLPYLAPVTVTNPANGKSLTLYKRDVGAGGPGLSSTEPRAIDLWYSAAAQLGISGLAAVQVNIGATGGGTFGSGGTGTPANTTTPSLWTVGDPAHPTQDYWTTMNQYAMNAQWYLFTDAETLFVADGLQLMAQRPQAVISRLDPAVIHVDLSYDNTAFTYTHTHKRRARIQRRTALARLTSPTEVIIQIVCDIDLFRSGDTVHLAADFGPAAGVWLIGNRIREIYLPYSELTLVQAMQPINASTSTSTGPGALTGPAASKPGAGTVIASMLSEATTINNSDYPYVYGGGHTKIGTPDIGFPGHGYDGHTIGFDCSGSVAAVLGAGGLLTWGGGNPGASNTIVDSLLSQNKVTPGPGTGTPECTLYDTPNHIFMRLNREFFGTEDGAGNLPPTKNQGAGWIPNGQPGTGFRVTHVPATILGQQAA